MPAVAASSDVLIGSSMVEHSHIANIQARGDFRRTGNAFYCAPSHNANMESDDDDLDKNGGPNHLKAWMKFRRVKGASLAKALNITPGMVSELANNKRALSAKWLRRIAPHLETTPGHLLDHDPNDLDSNVVDIWMHANPDQRRQITEVAKALVRTGVE